MRKYSCKEKDEKENHEEEHNNNWLNALEFLSKFWAGTHF